MIKSSLLNTSMFLRKRRMKCFLATLEVGSKDTILDVGGVPETWEGTGFESNVSLFNCNRPDNPDSPLVWIEGDACEMSMFTDKSIDVVFSNSVIEHVGDYERQLMMAKEIRRIGKKYWVQTPYKHFPLETHFIFSFFQYMPKKIQYKIALYWPFSFSKIYGLNPVSGLDHLRLLSKKDMREMFPDGLIEQEKFLGLTKSLIALKT